MIFGVKSGGDLIEKGEKCHFNIRGRPLKIFFRFLKKMLLYDKKKNVVLIHSLNDLMSSCAPCLGGNKPDGVVKFNRPFEVVRAPGLVGNTFRVDPGEKKSIVYKDGAIEKTLTIDGSSFSMVHEYVYDIDDVSGVEILWDAGVFPTEPSIHPSMSYSSDELPYSSIYAYQGGDLESLSQSTQKDIAETLIDEKTDWVAIRTKFFAAAMIL